MYVGCKDYKTESLRKLFSSFFKGILVCILIAGCAERPASLINVDKVPPTVTIVSPSKADSQTSLSKSFNVKIEEKISKSIAAEPQKGNIGLEENSDTKKKTAEKPVVNRNDQTGSNPKSAGVNIYKKGADLLFEGYAVVGEDTLGDSSLRWTSDIEGEIGRGYSFTKSDLSEGEHKIVLTATDSEGGVGRDTVRIFVADQAISTGNQIPTVKILSLEEGWSLLNTTELILRGVAEDPEDGELEGGSLVWKSSKDGVLGTGSPLDVTGKLSLGDHTITLMGTDSNGNTGQSNVNISITDKIDDTINNSPAANILNVGDILTLLDTDILSLEGSASDPDGEVVSMEWSSDIDGKLGTGATLEIPAGDLTLGDHTITFTATDDDGAIGSDRVVVTIEEETVNELPSAIINITEDILTLLESEILSLDGSASDSDGEIVSMVWSSDLDGELGTGANLEKPASDLTLGGHTITFTATDNDGATGSDSVEVTIHKPPVADIISPNGGEILLETDELVLEGSGSDEEDGSLDGTSLSWSSNLDGELGTGNTLNVTGVLSAGEHTITLTATDSEGATGSEQVSISVNLAPPTNLTAEALNSTTVRLRWQDNSNSETHFNIEMRIGDFFEPAGTAGENVSSFDVTDLQPESLYEFRVSAENNDGTSDYSNLVEVTTLPTQISSTVTADNTVDSSQPETAITGGTLKLVNSTELQTENRIALEFSDLQDLISGRPISKATLQLTEAGLLDVSLNLEMATRRFTNSWDPDSLTWNNHLEKIGIEDLLSYNITIDVGKTVELDITSIVEAWASKEWANHGLLLKSNSELLNVEFESLDTVGQAPQIIVDFAD